MDAIVKTTKSGVIGGILGGISLLYVIINTLLILNFFTGLIAAEKLQGLAYCSSYLFSSAHDCSCNYWFFYKKRQALSMGDYFKYHLVSCTNWLSRHRYANIWSLILKNEQTSI